MTMHHAMNGMISDGDMTSLEAQQEAAVDKSLLTMMIAHHTGAIEMAVNQLKGGESASALALATSIQVSQQSEITQMKALLKQ